MTSDSFPVLASDRLDYVESAYDVAVSRAPKCGGMTVRHRISGRNLVASLLKGLQATFAVEVSSPYATFREVRRADAPGEVETVQTVSWGEQEVIPPVYVRPLVIATVAEPSRIVLNGEHGVHDVWRGVEVELLPGAILAADQFWRAASTWQSLIRLVSNDDLPQGAYQVTMSSGEGFHFRVDMHPELFATMVNPGDSHRHHCQSILTGCLSRGLELVRQEYAGGSEQWRESPVLRALHDKLERQGLGTWDDDEFYPDLVATQLKRITFGSVEGG